MRHGDARGLTDSDGLPPFADAHARRQLTRLPRSHGLKPKTTLHPSAPSWLRWGAVCVRGRYPLARALQSPPVVSGQFQRAGNSNSTQGITISKNPSTLCYASSSSVSRSRHRSQRSPRSRTSKHVRCIPSRSRLTTRSCSRSIRQMHGFPFSMPQRWL